METNVELDTEIDVELDEIMQIITEMFGERPLITNLEFNEEYLIITIDDIKIKLYNNDITWSCNYMTSDDDIPYYVGSQLYNIERRIINNKPPISINNKDEDEDEFVEKHEIEFLIITTSLGAFTIEAHNKHTGWYSGFALMATINPPFYGKYGY